MFERYTERARQLIPLARYEAVQFGSTKIETEHFLLALILDSNLASRFFPTSSEVIRKEIEGRITIREKVSTSVDLPISNECKRILAYAAEEAERLNHRHIGTEHMLLGILREEKCMAAEILQQYGLRVSAIREELVRSPMPVERRLSFLPHEMGPGAALPKGDVVPDADTAKRIAEAVWIPQFGADTVARQSPVKVKLVKLELKFNVWIVTGSSSTEAPLFAFILQTNGRILDLGGPSKPQDNPKR
jgi:Clp amino terminal domain, pathogenicity island component